MQGLSIQLQQVQQNTNQIRQVNQKMYDTLITMKQLMMQLEGEWISNGSQEIRQRFQQLSARFEQHQQVIDAYATFLDTAIASYQSLEATITANASNMQV